MYKITFQEVGLFLKNWLAADHIFMKFPAFWTKTLDVATTVKGSLTLPLFNNCLEIY